MDYCIAMFEDAIDDLTSQQLAELDQSIKDYDGSPAKFAKWLIRKIKEWLEN